MKLPSPKNPQMITVISVTDDIAKHRLTFSGVLPTYELIYTLEGKSEISFHRKHGTDEANTVRFLPKGGENGEYEVNILQKTSCIDIFFLVDNPKDFPTEMLISSVKNAPTVRNLFTQLLQVWNRKEVGYEKRSLSLFYEILYFLELEEARYQPTKKQQRIAPAISYLHEHYTDVHVNYALLSSLCSMSDSYFRRLFTERFGVLPSAYVRNLKIGYAEELLSSGKISVTEAAELCGFENIYYFSRVFKKETGISPSAYSGKYLKNKI